MYNEDDYQKEETLNAHNGVFIIYECGENIWKLTHKQTYTSSMNLETSYQEFSLLVKITHRIFITSENIIPSTQNIWLSILQPLPIKM